MVELMIAIWQATENGLANFVRIQLRVQRWHCGIGEAVVEIDRDPCRQLLAERVLRFPNQRSATHPHRQTVRQSG